MNKKPIVGAFGSASSKDAQLITLAQEVGAKIKEGPYHLLTGACPGLPLAAAQGAYTGRENQVIGISPFGNVDEHLRRGMILDHHDLIIYTGLGDHLQGSAAYSSRNPINAQSVDVAIVLPGSAGTISELELCLTKGKPAVIVSGMDKEFDEGVQEITRKLTRPPVFYSNDPHDIQGYLQQLF